MAAHLDASTQLSPKVVWSAAAGLGLSILGAIIVGVGTALGAFTSANLPELGVWAVPVAMLLSTVGQSIVAWWKTDPLRQEALQKAEKLAEVQAELTIAKQTGTEQNRVG